MVNYVNHKIDLKVLKDVLKNSPIFFRRLPDLPLILILLSLVYLVSASPASAASPTYPVSFSWDVTQASKYVWQGEDYSNNKPVAQPELALSYKNLSFISWFNFDQDQKVFDEIDLYFQYTQEFQKLTLTPGYAYYRYPTRVGWDPTQEAYLDLAYATFLNPTLSIHYDYDVATGSYFTLGVSEDLETRLGTFAFGSNLFYRSGYYDMTGFPSMEFNGNYSYSRGSLSISPSISYFLTWNNDDFNGVNSIPETWLFSINVAQDF